MSADFKIKFGTNLRDARVAKGFTQQELADIVGSQQPAYSRIENGETNVTLKTIIKLSEALDVSPEIFFKEWR